MSALSDALAHESDSQPRPRCAIARLKAELDPADLTVLQQALEGTMYGTKIARALRATGHNVSQYSITRPRKRECSCESV